MMQIQVRLQKNVNLIRPYSYGPYNKVKGNKQAIRISEGCPWNCPNCKEPTEFKWFGVPEITKNEVLIFDMNLLCKVGKALPIIKELGEIKVNGRRVKYELVCGADYRYMNQQIANALFNSNFGYVGFFPWSCIKKKIIRIAWDGPYSEQKKIKKAIDMLLKAGYKRKEIALFMQANYRLVSYEECCLKLDLCKVWNVKVEDCYFDGQLSPKIIPIYWTVQEIKSFRKKVRKHNQLVNFGIDPEV